MARYFVTGATGFLGGELVKQLIGRGHQVVALVRSAEKAALLKALGVELHVGDITERESLRAPMTGAEGVFHVAAWYKIGVRNDDEFAEYINVQGTRHVLEIARELRIPRIVYTSTVGVFGDTRGTVGRRNLLRARPVPDRVRPDEVDGALRRGGADDARPACR